jgi:ParB family chromosome partitioning protein
MTKKALGRGIDAIISRVNSEIQKEEIIKKIPLDLIIPNRHQPRQNFDEESIKELAQSIKENGLINPITVTKIEANKYEIIAGERRYRACKYLGWKEIDAIIKNNVDENKKIITALIENIQREDLNPYEKAMAYKKMIEMGLTQQEISEHCGKSKSSISNTLRLLELDEEIIEGLKNGLITEGHARALLQIPDIEEREKIYNKIISEKLNVREVEEYSKTYYQTKTTERKKRNKTSEIIEMEKLFESSLVTKVEIKPLTETSGKIIINYFSLDDFERIKRKLS